MTVVDIWDRYNHVFPVTQMVLSMRVLEMSSHASKQITEDDEIVVCPSCRDWHLVSWRIAA